MKVVAMDFKENNIIMNLESPLLAEYYPNFKRMILGYKGGIPGLSIDKVGNKGAEIKLPANSQKHNMIDGNTLQLFLDPLFISQLDFFDEFAIKRKLKSTEFIPLSGYDTDRMSEEVKGAVENKRNLLFIKSFKEYKNMTKGEYKFNQYELKYGTSEYADAIIMIRNKDWKSIKKIYSNKLEFVNWRGK